MTKRAVSVALHAPCFQIDDGGRNALLVLRSAAKSVFVWVRKGSAQLRSHSAAIVP